jgi:HK97 family phage prohead protease
MLYQQRAAPPPGGEPDEFVMSDGSVDRMGDVVDPAGWELDSIKSDPVVLFNHNRDHIVGRWTNIRVKDGQLIGRIIWVKSDKWPMAQYIRDLVREGVLRTVSVGFQPVSKEPLNKEQRNGPFRFTRQQLLECSLVSVPANPNALAIAKDFPRDVLKAVFCESARSFGEQRAVHAESGKSLVPKNGAKMTLSQKIQASQKRITGLRDQLAELAAKDNLDNDELQLTKELPDMIEAEQNDLARLENMEKSLAPRVPAVPAVVSAQPEIITPEKAIILPPKKKFEAVDHVFRAMSVAVKAYGTQTPVEQTLRDMYGADDVTGYMLKAAVNPAMTTVAGYAAELVQIGYGGLMDRLMAGSIYGPLSGYGSKFDFGRNGSIKIPVRSNTPRAAGAWVGEGAAKPVKKITLTPITLTPFKMAVITTFTEEMAFYSTPAIEGVLRKAMADDTREALDGFLIDNVAASSVRPAGLLNGVSGLTPSAASTRIDKIVADLNALIAPMEAAGGGGNVVLIMNPAQARAVGMAQTTTGDFAFAGTGEAASKFGIKAIITSTTVTAGTVIAVDADWFTTAVGDTPRFAVSTEATLHEEDTTPLALGSGTQGSGVLAVPMRSLFQTDSVAIRLSLYVTWAMTRTGMVQYVPGVTW